MTVLANQIVLTLKWALRDRIMHAVLGVALLMLLLVPVLSLFSMRQVQELSITLSLSAVSVILLILAVLLGSSSVWRDIERRYTSSVLTLPFSRSSYVVARFCGIALFLLACAVVLGAASLVVIALTSQRYPSELPVHWLAVLAAVGADALKYILLAAVALLFSCLSTSFFLPFFATLAMYLAGSSSQEVFEYVSGKYGKEIPELSATLIKGLYYLLPNFSAFDLKVQAIYGLPLQPSGLLYTAAYFAVYTALVLCAAVAIFSRRQLP
jgi:Cu-processing system permease protein